MITGLLFTLSQKPLVAANDDAREGRAFPSSFTEKPKLKKTPRHGLVSLARVLSIALGLAGTALLVAATSSWSFDPVNGLRIEAVAQNLIRHMGVNS
jgi:hypothetical protein